MACGRILNVEMEVMCLDVGCLLFCTFILAASCRTDISLANWKKLGLAINCIVVEYFNPFAYTHGWEPV
jgi:hypothetical protein